MPVIVTAGAASQDLTTLDAVNAELGRTTGADTAGDALITQMIHDASAAIGTFCRRPLGFARASFQENLTGQGEQQIMLSETPIVSVASVMKDSDAVTDYVVEDADVGILYRDLGFDFTTSMGSPFRDWPLPNNHNDLYVVQYDAGYLLPGQSQPSSPALPAPALPADISRACKITVKDWFQRRNDRAGQPIKEKRVDDLSIVYADSAVAVGQIPTPAAQLLHPYIRES